MKYIDELYRTPDILNKVVDTKPEEILVNAPLVAFCGCGTSFYIASQLAKLCTVHGKNAVAVEAVDLIESSLLIENKYTVFVFISRSGSSMETVIAMHKVKEEGFATFYLGCTEDSILDRECDKSKVIGYANETLVLESFSYTAQMMCLALCCNLEVSSDSISHKVKKALDLSRNVFRQSFQHTEIKRMICLGSPFYMPLLKEMMLKNGEITQKSSEVWGILEFRHGPRSWADDKCLITVVPGIQTYDYDIKVAKELVSYGSNVIWFGKDPVKGALNIELDATKYSVDEVLIISGFLTGLAAEIGESCGVDASKLKHVVHAVGEL